MAIKLNRDGSVDKRWKPQTEADYRELLAYEQKRLRETIRKAEESIKRANKQYSRALY